MSDPYFEKISEIAHKRAKEEADHFFGTPDNPEYRECYDRRYLSVMRNMMPPPVKKCCCCCKCHCC